MQIIEAYLHVLDARNDVRLFSERPMGLDIEIEEYIQKHVEGFFEHLDIAVLSVEATVLANQNAQDFKETSLQIAELFYDSMEKSEEIKPCDLMCLHFERDGHSYYGFLKLNFRTSYAHAVELENQLLVNKIIRQVTTLPYKSQKVEEGFLIDIMHKRALIKDKSVLMDGNKVKYITENVLALKSGLTPKRTIEIMSKTAQVIAEKYDSQPMVKSAQIKHKITEQLEGQGELNIQEIVDECFDVSSAREAFVQVLNDKGIDADALVINDTQKKKLKRTQKIKTASGVEIILPFEYVSRSENMEIINHPDGSVSISLKNLGELI